MAKNFDIAGIVIILEVVLCVGGRVRKRLCHFFVDYDVDLDTSLRGCPEQIVYPVSVRVNKFSLCLI